jgi:hypothetical protein
MRRRAKPADFLQHDRELRIRETRVRLNLVAPLGHPGDQAADVTLRWPDEGDREAARLGMIAITVLELNETCDEEVSNQSQFADGTGFRTDDILAARLSACAISRKEAVISLKILSGRSSTPCGMIDLVDRT